MATITCAKCGRVKQENNFYVKKDGTKTDLCKQCLTMHVDSFNPETFLWILQKIDVPYIPTEWNILREKEYAQHPETFNSATVLGRYLAKMKLKQFKPYHWEDSEKLQEEEEKRNAQLEAENKEREAWAQEKFDNGEISEAEYKTLVNASTRRANGVTANSTPITNPIYGIAADGSAGAAGFFHESQYMKVEDVPDLGAELTDEDKKHLVLKWGRLYKPSEWVELEKMYTEMTNSFDIQDADTINTLILICKMNLKANQALDTGDLDAFSKLSRALESMRKSAKFTAAQKKDEKVDAVDCLGEIVLMCERQGFIPKYAPEEPQDKVDLTLRDMNTYVRKLVTQDLGFGQQIEDALKKIQIQKEMSKEADALPDPDDADMIGSLMDSDFENYYEDIEEEKDKDKKTMKGEEK